MIKVKESKIYINNELEAKRLNLPKGTFIPMEFRVEEKHKQQIGNTKNCILYLFGIEFDDFHEQEINEIRHELVLEDEESFIRKYKVLDKKIYDIGVHMNRFYNATLICEKIDD